MATDTGGGAIDARVSDLLRPPAPPLVRHAVFAVAYAVAVYLGRLTTSPTTGVALVWPAAGVAFAWFLAARTCGPAVRVSCSWIATLLITVITLVLNMLSGMGLDRAVAFAVGNALAGYVAGWIYHRLSAREVFLTRLRHVLPLFAASCGAGVGSTLGGPLYSVLVHQGDLGLLWQALARTGVGNVVFGAAALRLISPPGTLPRPGGRGLLLVTTIVGVGYATAFVAFPHLPITFILTGVSVAVALVCTLDQVVFFLVAAGSLIVLASLAHIGPFARGTVLAEVFIAQGFVAVNALIALLLVLGRSDQAALVGALSEARRKADTQRELLDHVVTAIPDAVLAVDDERVTVANAAAADLFGLTPGDAAAGSALMSGGAAGEGPLDRALRGADVAEDIVYDESDSSRVLSLRAHRLNEASASAVVVARDVTEHRRWVSELSSFASVLAHDLLNPIGAVQGWLEVAEEESDESTPRAVRSGIARAKGSAVRLREIVTGLHAYSVARGGELSMTDIDLHPLVERLAGGRIAAATTQANPVAPVITVDAHRLVRGDQALVAQVIDNLLGNSIKYSVPGRVPHIVIGAAEPENGFVTVRIDDDGIGIPVCDRQKVFEEFHRVEGHTKAYVGTGLGLSICRRMIARHGGSIRATDSPLGGTRMEFTLPAAGPAEGVAPDLARQQGAVERTVGHLTDRLTPHPSQHPSLRASDHASDHGIDPLLAEPSEELSDGGTAGRHEGATST